MSKKKPTMFELNEKYKDYPARTNTYIIDGKTYNVTSRFVGDKDIDEVIYRLAFKRAFYETTGFHISDDEIEYPSKKKK